MTEDRVTLRGIHIAYEDHQQDSSKGVDGSQKRVGMIQYMHGTRVYLPHKINYFRELSRELQADIIAFAYRSFSSSDEAHPNEAGFQADSDAITRYFE